MQVDLSHVNKPSCVAPRHGIPTVGSMLVQLRQDTHLASRVRYCVRVFESVPGTARQALNLWRSLHTLSSVLHGRHWLALPPE